jgi:hypothetical protein
VRWRKSCGICAPCLAPSSKISWRGEAANERSADFRLRRAKAPLRRDGGQSAGRLVSKPGLGVFQRGLVAHTFLRDKSRAPARWLGGFTHITLYCMNYGQKLATNARTSPSPHSQEERAGERRLFEANSPLSTRPSRGERAQLRPRLMWAWEMISSGFQSQNLNIWSAFPRGDCADRRHPGGGGRRTAASLRRSGARSRRRKSAQSSFAARENGPPPKGK